MAASRKARSSSGWSFATPENPSSNTVTPSGRAPSASLMTPSAAVVGPLRGPRGMSLIGGARDGAAAAAMQAARLRWIADEDAEDDVD